MARITGHKVLWFRKRAATTSSYRGVVYELLHGSLGLAASGRHLEHQYDGYKVGDVV